MARPTGVGFANPAARGQAVLSLNRKLSNLFGAGAALFLAVSAAAGQDGPAFKRLSAPEKGTAPKIDVQIDPQEYFDWFDPDVAPEDPAPVQVRSDPDAPRLPYPLFWRQVASSGGVPGMARLEVAMRTTGLSGPRLADLQRMADAYGRHILLSTVGTRVSPALALAVMSVESAGRPDAVSTAGAQGLMQLIPATAERFGVSDAFAPDQNIRGGVAYLDWLMKEFGGNPVKVLAAYNSGENNVRKHDGAPPFAETRAYVPKVLAAWAVARGLCLTPPELISDGCVFKQTEVAREG